LADSQKDKVMMASPEQDNYTYTQQELHKQLARLLSI